MLFVMGLWCSANTQKATEIAVGVSGVFWGVLGGGPFRENATGSHERVSLCFHACFGKLW